MIEIPEDDWNKFSREAQIDWIIENNADYPITINELKAWCEIHAFDKDVKDPVLNKNLNHPFSFTGRWVLALLTMGYLHKRKGMEYCHYRRDIMPEMNRLFSKSGKNYDITNIATLGRKPYELIIPADKVRLGEDYDCDGMWKLGDNAYKLLNKNINNRIKVPKTVLFSTVNVNKFKIVGDNYILWEEAKMLNLKETLEILKTF